MYAVLATVDVSDAAAVRGRWTSRLLPRSGQHRGSWPRTGSGSTTATVPHLLYSRLRAGTLRCARGGLVRPQLGDLYQRPYRRGGGPRLADPDRTSPATTLCPHGDVVDQVPGTCLIALGTAASLVDETSLGEALPCQ